MRNSLTKSIALSLAALTLGIGLCAAPASAGPIKKIYPPHPWHHHHGGWGWGGGALALGLIGGAVAADMAYSSCYRSAPIYDGFGSYLGSQTVNVCQ